MADQGTHASATSTGGNSGLAFVVGALVVVVAVLAWFMLDESREADGGVTINVEGAGAAVEDAAEAVEGAVSGN